MIFDVFIVCAGSSRSYLAYLLARQGSSAAVTDQEEFLRDKSCGRGVHVNRHLAGLVLGTMGYKECFYPLPASLPYWSFSKRYGYSPGLQL